MKILVLIDVLEDIKGGAERQVFELLKFLSERGHELYLKALHQNFIPDEVKKLNIDAEGLGITRIYDLNGILKGFKLLCFIKKKNIDTVITYHFSADIWGTFFSYLSGVKNIFSSRRDDGFWRNGLHKKAYRLINVFVVKIIVVSEGVKKMVVKEEGVPDDKIEVLYNGVDAARFGNNVRSEALKKELGFTDSDLIMVSVGNFTPVKGHKFLVEGFVSTSNDFPNAYLLLIGDGPLRSMLSFMVKEKRLQDRIIFLGKRNDVVDLLDLSDICILPSLSEGLSNALLEYMAAAKPIIATKVGGNTEVITDGVNGILIEPGNPAAISWAIRNLLKNDELRRKIAVNAEETANTKFSLQAMLAKYEKLLLHLNKPKVLHLVSSNGIFGAENVILGLAKSCNNISVIVGALSNFHNPHLEMIEEAARRNFKTAFFDCLWQFDFLAIIRVRRYLKKHKIDILHTHNYKSDLIGFCATRFLKTKWVATNHVWHGTDSKLKLYEALDALVLRFAHKVIAVSDEIKGDLINKKIASESLEVIYNGIDHSEFVRKGKNDLKRLREEFKIGENDVVISSVGRLSREKGQDILIKSFRILTDKVRSIKLLFVGDGPLRSELESIADRELPKGSFIFAGIRKDMQDIYSLTDILVSASYIEGLPLNILEGMAAKTAIVATRVGAVSQVIKDRMNGMLVDAGQVDALAGSLYSVVTDVSLRNRLVEHAYSDLIEIFNVQKMASRYESVYSGLLQ